LREGGAGRAEARPARGGPGSDLDPLRGDAAELRRTREQVLGLALVVGEPRLVDEIVGARLPRVELIGDDRVRVRVVVAVDIDDLARRRLDVGADVLLPDPAHVVALSGFRLVADVEGLPGHLLSPRASTARWRLRAR